MRRRGENMERRLKNTEKTWRKHEKAWQCTRKHKKKHLGKTDKNTRRHGNA